MTILKLKHSLRLLIRQGYEDISEPIQKEPQDCGGSVIVSGQRGIGKTAYLYFRIIENIIEGRPFLYQAIGGTVYHVSEKSVEVVQSWSSDESIVAFVNGDEGNSEPDQLLFRRSVQLVVASSPRGAFMKWTKQTGHASFVTKLAVKLWSHEELLLTGIFLHPSDLTFKLLRKSTSYFGYNPRRCFEASSSVARLELETSEVASIINNAADNGRADILHLVRKTQMGDSNVSHTIFQNFPTDTNTRRLLSDCQIEPVSRWALDLLLQQYKGRQADVIADLYYLISTTFEAMSLRGHLFERQVLNHLCGISTECKFSIRGLTDFNQMTWTYRGPIGPTAFQESTVVKEITEAVRSQMPRHLVPLVRNFRAVDSILDPDDPDGVVTCIQITMNKEHAIVVSDLQRIQSWLQLDTPLEGLRPKKSRPWRFLFVVPLDMVSTFQSQRLDGDTAEGSWASKVDQYVLGLEEQTIFGMRSDSSVQHAITSRQWEHQMMAVDDT